MRPWTIPIWCVSPCTNSQKDVEADMFLVGFVGRKGPKEDPSVLGSAADYSLRSAHITAAVVKDKTFRDPATLLVGVDGSERAHSAACLAVRLARPTDSIHIVHMVVRTNIRASIER
jgi:nucleotide-binding universal stress UspA family protein